MSTAQSLAVTVSPRFRHRVFKQFHIHIKADRHHASAVLLDIARAADFKLRIAIFSPEPIL